jgi:hypothetical protein
VTGRPFTRMAVRATFVTGVSDIKAAIGAPRCAGRAPVHLGPLRTARTRGLSSNDNDCEGPNGTAKPTRIVAL